MLSKEDNERLTRVGPGTPMGEMLRELWTPAVRSASLVADGAPKPFRLLGEDLVAFRATDGEVGVLEEGCPHRRTSLALAVNAENGLRCLYHGWKFDRHGNCQDMPAEPDGSSMCARIKAVAYPAMEAAGMVWVYMGPPEHKPAFPYLEWTSYPKANVMASKILGDCNYAQLLEGTIDSAHAGVLHRESPWGHAPKLPHERDLKPKLEVEYTKYGLRYGAIRKTGEGKSHVRVTQVVLPFMTLIPPDGAGSGVRENRRMANAFVPRDDFSTWHIQWFFDTTKPVDHAARVEEGGIWLKEGFSKELNIGNWYGQDRDMMATTNMSGIKGILVQDHAVSETQGKISDRSKEHLGTSDVAVVAWRRQLIRVAKALAETGEAPGILSPDLPWGNIKGATIICDSALDWKNVEPVGANLSA